ncbi:MAG: class I SAM-dependent methyltransferase [Actinobacteria bacterium]|jgi:predicted O-methyltransferase YrrM|nr:class I SAM-dependent methyltransferase [Actinomycetota bacterium]NCV96134.1 class I SAM-dependent methyltransferase [Actinomycetota bacterium]NCW47495.1 class I SAM-dependent methyltransferase [Actinomycetota bacterium]NCW76103.1 class I SAM-dependent methyltransferase [Actinomycetota bacterium]NCW97106.1 class I SAM-dependent methyltransferase [Actinomycetota bacterium]
MLRVNGVNMTDLFLILLAILNVTGITYLAFKVRRISIESRSNKKKIKEIKLMTKEINKAVSKEVSTKKESKRDFQLMEAYYQLINLLDFKSPIPRTRGFAASPDLLLEIYRLIMKYRPKLIVELGSGLSTLVIAKSVQQTNDSKVVSIDHSLDYLNETTRLLNEHEIDSVELIHAPIDMTTNWYSTKWLTELKEIDLLVIDGPPKALGENVRSGALDFFLNRLSPNAVVVIDDAYRPGESKLASDFATKMPLHNLVVLDHEKGTALILPQG